MKHPAHERHDGLIPPFHINTETRGSFDDGHNAHEEEETLSTVMFPFEHVSAQMVRDEGISLLRDCLDFVLQVVLLAFTNGALFPVMSDADRTEFSIQLATLSLFFAFWFVDLLHEREMVFGKVPRWSRAAACVASPVAFVVSICSAIAVQRAVPTDILTEFRIAVIIFLGVLSLVKIANGVVKCVTLYSWRCDELEHYYKEQVHGHGH